MADQENENNSAPTEEATETGETPAEPQSETTVDTPADTETHETLAEVQPVDASPNEQSTAEEGAHETESKELSSGVTGIVDEAHEGQVATDGENASPKPADEHEGEKTGEEAEKTEEGHEVDTNPEGAEEGHQTETVEGGEDIERKEDEDATHVVVDEATDGEQIEVEVKEGEQMEEETKPDGEEVSKSPVPQSDTFAEGERAESPLGVGEKLSREGSPVQKPDIPVPDILEPGTPERSRPASVDGEKEHVPLTTFEEEDEEEEESDEEDEDQAEFDREELLERYHQAIAEREQLQQSNYQLQHKLAEYFRKKKADESRQEYDKNVTDQEQRYLKYMAQLEDLRRQDMQERENYKHQIEELKTRCEERKEKVDEERRKFMDFKKQVALNSLNSRSGRPIAPKDIEQYLSAENRKEAEVVNVRLENIKLKNKLKKKEHQLKSKEELAEGLHLIDFEQLKIENQTYNEKIEERNEELLKLRKKITSTVQVLTHLKEKLQYVQAENQVQKRNLRDVEAEVGQKRDRLSRTKQARDYLRIDNQKLRQSCGLLGNEALLRDFEDRIDEGEELRDKLERLKMQHAELTLHCNQVRRKIEQARTGRA